MELVDDEVTRGADTPACIAPRKRAGIHDLGRPVHTLGLKTGGWIGDHSVAVDAVGVTIAGSRSTNPRFEHAALVTGERMHSGGLAGVDDEIEGACVGSPDAEADAVL